MSDLLRAQLKDQIMKVDYTSYDLSVRELISMVNDGMVDIAPEYQRKFRWGNDRQSNFIESLFLGIPIPSLFVATNSDGTWELIDGVQRLSTILRFAGGEVEKNQKSEDDSGQENLKPLKLEGLEKLPLFNGKRFVDLPPDIQNKFKLTMVKLTALTDKSDSNVRFDLFERLNRGGVNLTDQEIRNCVYRGPFHEFIKNLSANEDFVQCVYLPDSHENDGMREELVLRFFAYLYDFNNFSHSVKDFLNNYMRKANKKFEYANGEVVFTTVFKTLNEALPNGITRRRNITPYNLFEAVSVGAAQTLLEKGKINTDGIETWIMDDKLKEYTTGGTNSMPKARNRINFCIEKFGGTHRV